MKKLFAILVSAVMLLSAAGCGTSGGAATDEQDNAEAAVDFPKENITMIIPQGLGGGSDLIARTLASELEKNLGVSVICKNVDGGSTSIGLQELGDIVGADTLENVSSWHHQNVDSVEGTNLTVVATATLNDVTLVEAIERQDKTFCLGVQFHPENDCALALYEGDTEAALCDLDTCLNFFRTLVSYAAQ